jgi:exopolyphosphatase / guanosine-5'-triphosphate,3'-diphosphate pyrophosphatase
MRCACIDIGSNTTRVLVADVEDGRLTEVVAQRAFTAIGRDLRATGAISEDKLEEVAAVVARHHGVAELLGTERLRAVATAAIRGAANGPELCAAVRGGAGVEVCVLTGEEEARLAFAGATQTLPAAPIGRVAVVDVGGGSSEIAVGTLARGVEWSASVPIGSGFLADSYLRSDPPSAAELEALRAHAAGALEGLDVPAPRLAVAVGGSATSLRRLVGPILSAEAIAEALGELARAPVAEVAARFELEPERVRLLPAGLLILTEAAARLGRPLQIGRGGLREGVCLELAAGSLQA